MGGEEACDGSGRLFVVRVRQPRQQGGVARVLQPAQLLQCVVAQCFVQRRVAILQSTYGDWVFGDIYSE